MFCGCAQCLLTLSLKPRFYPHLRIKTISSQSEHSKLTYGDVIKKYDLIVASYSFFQGGYYRALLSLDKKLAMLASGRRRSRAPQKKGAKESPSAPVESEDDIHSKRKQVLEVWPSSVLLISRRYTDAMDEF